MFYKKFQSVVEYSILIAGVVCALIATSGYLKRSMQGRILVSAEQLAERYDYGKTNLVERTTTRRSVVNWALPAPRNVIKERGDYSFYSQREFKDEN
ncbi:MAG: hypothetical protein NC918_06060 [Candidatus Omnitrophica bacterium]|nr:hypothetical protein [Candidatus Omnitrophota bacterium]